MLLNLTLLNIFFCGIIKWNKDGFIKNIITLIKHVTRSPFAHNSRETIHNYIQTSFYLFVGAMHNDVNEQATRAHQAFKGPRNEYKWVKSKADMFNKAVPVLRPSSRRSVPSKSRLRRRECAVKSLILADSSPWCTGRMWSL